MTKVNPLQADRIQIKNHHHESTLRLRSGQAKKGKEV
jgi:hypothetical protein